jgi:hypothetical protein
MHQIENLGYCCSENPHCFKKKKKSVGFFQKSKLATKFVAI